MEAAVSRLDAQLDPIVGVDRAREPRLEPAGVCPASRRRRCPGCRWTSWYDAMVVEEIGRRREPLPVWLKGTSVPSGTVMSGRLRAMPKPVNNSLAKMFNYKQTNKTNQPGPLGSWGALAGK